MENTDYQKVLDYLRRLCSAREYCVRDIRDKALKRLESEEDVQRAVTSLIDDGYLCERRYAAAFARDKASIAGWGPVKIRFALKAKEVDDATISDALKEIDHPKAEERMRKVIEAKYRILEADPQVKIKLLKFALSRGYSYDSVSGIIDALVRNKSHFKTGSK